MVTIVAGVPAVGKSRACRHLCPFEFDDWVKEKYGIPDVEEATKAYRSEYPQSNAEYLGAVCERHRHGDVVVCDTFTYRDDRIEAVDFLRRNGISQIHLVYLVASWKTVEARNRSRSSPLSEGTMMDLWFNQEFPTQNEGFDSVEIVSNE